jgi:two-component SAPR family response regulator
LVAEDNVFPAMEIEDIARELNCRVVGPVTKLADLMKLIDSTEFDVALLDIDLQGGEKVYPAVTILRARGVPFAFFTAYGRETLGDEYEHDQVIEKPFRRADLEQCILDWIRDKDAADRRGGALTCGA